VNLNSESSRKLPWIDLVERNPAPMLLLSAAALLKPFRRHRYQKTKPTRSDSVAPSTIASEHEAASVDGGRLETAAALPVAEVHWIYGHAEPVISKTHSLLNRQEFMWLSRTSE
jgi:hypothetical protein